MVNLRLYAWVTRSGQRMAILRVFDKPMTSSEVQKKNKDEEISLENMCDVLRSFVEEGIAVCINEDAEMGRVYRLTKDGEEIRGELMGE